MPRKLLLVQLCLAALFTGTSHAAKPAYKDTIGGFPVEGVISSAINDCENVVFTTNQAVVPAKRNHRRGKFE
jgi:hypothetical protein